MVSARKQLNTKLTMIDKLNYLPLRSHAQENTFHSADQKRSMDFKSAWGSCQLWTRRFPVNLNRVMLHFDDQVKKKNQKKKII